MPRARTSRATSTRCGFDGYRHCFVPGQGVNAFDAGSKAFRIKGFRHCGVPGQGVKCIDLAQVVKFIDEVRAAGRKVLVHCTQVGPLPETVCAHCVRGIQCEITGFFWGGVKGRLGRWAENFQACRNAVGAWVGRGMYLSHCWSPLQQGGSLFVSVSPRISCINCFVSRVSCSL